MVLVCTNLQCHVLLTFVLHVTFYCSYITKIVFFFSDFIEVPSPPVVVVPLDGLHNTYQYRCRHSETDRIFWIINGTRLVDLRPPPPSISDPTILLPSGDLVYTLTIGGLLQHNGTTIQCLAESQDQSSTSRTPNAVFLIQGI